MTRALVLPAVAAAERPRRARWVDLRSPAEYARDHVPGAVSAPLLDDAQRALVGTLYHRVSPEAAYETGLAEVEGRLADLLAAVTGRVVPEAEWRPRFRDLAAALRRGAAAVELEPTVLPNQGAGWTVVACWRGGLRSRSVAALLHLLGERVAVLAGGYKAWRRHVLERLAAWEPPSWGGRPSPFLVVSGPTGTGKTRVLRELERRAPGTVLDLEGLAGHRSSILGAVGLEPVGQPAFESALLERLDALGPPPWFVEAESRKVGDRILPEPLWRAMRSGVVAALEAEPATRVAVLLDDYLGREGNRDQLAERLPFLERRLGARWAGRLVGLLRAGREAELAELLLERYYDPLYRHSGADLRPSATFRVEEGDLAGRLLAWREGLVAAASGPPSAAIG